MQTLQWFPLLKRTTVRLRCSHQQAAAANSTCAMRASPTLAESRSQRRRPTNLQKAGDRSTCGSPNWPPTGAASESERSKQRLPFSIQYLAGSSRPPSQRGGTPLHHLPIPVHDGSGPSPHNLMIDEKIQWDGASPLSNAFRRAAAAAGNPRAPRMPA